MTSPGLAFPSPVLAGTSALHSNLAVSGFSEMTPDKSDLEGRKIADRYPGEHSGECNVPPDQAQQDTGQDQS